MKFSLIMATIGRTFEVEDFIKSLLAQKYKNYELIVLDQNSHRKIEKIIEKYTSSMSIKYIRSNEKGLSLNRNKGLKVAEGDIVAFPDDDCEYSDDILEEVKKIFESHLELDIISTKTLEKGKNYGIGEMKKKDCNISQSNILETVKSITIFIKIKKGSIKFDELLGAGKEFGSGEETDYILKHLHQGYRGRFFSDLVVYHPAKRGNYNNLEREYKYALGFGALCKKESIHRKNFIFFIIFIKKTYRNLFGILISKHRKYHYTLFRGKVIGFIKYRNRRINEVTILGESSFRKK